MLDVDYCTAYTAMKQLAQAVNQRQHDEEALDRVLTVQALFNNTVEGAALPPAQQVPQLVLSDSSVLA